MNFRLFRGKDKFEATGQVEFRDFFLERRKGQRDEFPLREVTCRPLEDVDEVTMDVLNGRKVTRVVKKKPCRTPRTSPLASGTAEVWVEDSMRAVMPLTMPRADAGKSIALSLARRADGFLFWLINGWQGPGRLPEGETFFPQFKTDGRRSDFPCGSVYLYPSEKHVLPSIRLAQMRDAVEDYEYLQLFAELKGRSAADRVVEGIVRSMTEFTRSPEALRKARRQLAETLGKCQ